MPESLAFRKLQQKYTELLEKRISQLETLVDATGHKVASSIWTLRKVNTYTIEEDKNKTGDKDAAEIEVSATIIVGTCSLVLLYGTDG